MVLDEIRAAYSYLKSYAYHENLNLYLKQRIAEFETSEFDASFKKIKDITEDEHDGDHFSQWLKRIDYHLLPKSITRKEDKLQSKENRKNGLFITNVRDSEFYDVSKVNYFIAAPVEIHIIEILWCLVVGPALEGSMTGDSYGNRLHPGALSFNESNGNGNGQDIFKRYIDQYNSWRDQAISTATDLNSQGENVALLSLDIKSYFYNIDIDFSEITNSIVHHYENDIKLQNKCIHLTKLLVRIYAAYNATIKRSLVSTHAKCEENKSPPIGFASSAIIANWYLSNFDKSIRDIARPAYYGRYVDDLLFIIKRPKFDESNPISSLIKEELGDFISENKKRNIYSLKARNKKLTIQKNKISLQFFELNHSTAGLDVFKQELDERSSAFRFLPTDHIDKELDRFAYDILYDGSANKLRSIVGLAENETELVKFLASHITAHRLCKLNKNDSVLPQLKAFLKGLNALQFHRIWEKIYQYTIVTRNYVFAQEYFEYISDEINKLQVITQDNDSISKSHLALRTN